MPDPNANADGNYIAQQIGAVSIHVETVYVSEPQTAVNSRPGPEANMERNEEKEADRERAR